MIREIQRIDIGGANRYRGLLAKQAEEVPADAIVRSIQAERVLLWGGEPTLRKDIIELITMVKERASWIAIRTDGLIFQIGRLAKQLREAGVDAVVVPIPSLKAGLNNWVLGKGFSKKAFAAMRLAKTLGFEVIPEIVVTRPGIDMIAQTCLGLSRQGVKKILIRAIEPVELGSNEQIAAIPRIGLLDNQFRKVLGIAKQTNVEIVFEGFPLCEFQRKEILQWRFTDRKYLSCRNNTHRECFVPESYVRQFGWSEISREEIDSKKVDFQWIEIRGDDSSRVIRQHLVQIAQTKPTELHILGDFTHPDIYEILRDALRLTIPKIWLVGNLLALDRISEKEWFRLKSLTGIAHLLHDGLPSSRLRKLFEKTQRFEQRVYAEVSSVDDLVRYNRLFLEKELSFAPHFIFTDRITISMLRGELHNFTSEIRANILDALPFCLGGAKQIKRSNQWINRRDRETASLWNIYRFVRGCPKEMECLASQSCCGIMKNWETDIQVITEVK